MINEFKKEHLEYEVMLKRYDEVIMQKASKTSLIGIEVKCAEKFVKKDDLME